MSKKILHFHVRFRYWDEVAEGKKENEYRLFNDYWKKYLLENDNYDLIYYWRAFTKKKMIFKYTGRSIHKIKHPEFGDKPVMVFDVPLHGKS